jgi:hypothetical protein
MAEEPAVTARTARMLVRCGWALTILLLAAAHAARAVLDDVAGPEDITVAFLLAVTALALTYSTVGGVIAARRPANPVGWIFLASALSAALILASATYAETATPVPPSGPVPAAGLAAFLSEALAFPTIALISFLLLLYPDGRPPSRRWRAAAWITVAAVAGSAIGAFAPGPLGDADPPVDNPLAIGGTLGRAIDALQALGGALLQLSLLLGAISMVVRFRRSRGDERLQLKWFVFTLALTGSFIALAVTASEVAPARSGANAVEEACFYLALVGVAALPVAAGMAILRYRLFDIDLVIRRTLVYAALTASLGATYLGLVLLAGLAVGDSSLAVAASTLVVAALFRPVRTRIQEAVDRRFYRRRYDMALTLERFGGRLRDEIDLEALGADLRGVARETLRPAHVGLWLREPER